MPKKTKVLTIKISSTTIAILIIFILVLSYFLISILKSRKENKEVESFFEEGSGQYVQELDINGTSIIFKEDKVLVAPPEREGKSIVIRKDTYPGLFQTWKNAIHVFNAQEIKDEVNKKQFIFIFRDVVARGGYQHIYGLIFDPKQGKIVYETPDLLADSPLNYIEMIENDSVVKFNLDPYFFWQSCIGCRLQLIEFVSYNARAKKYKPVNLRFREEFENLLREYNKIANENCSFRGEITPVSEIEKIAGKDAKCEDTITPTNPTQDPDYFITIGEFNEIRDKIRDVISGERDSAL